MIMIYARESIIIIIKKYLYRANSTVIKLFSMWALLKQYMNYVSYWGAKYVL